MKKLYLLGVLIGLVVVGILAMLMSNRGSFQVPLLDNEQHAGWLTVAPPSGLFSVRMPNAPQEAHNTLPIADSSDVVEQSLYMAKDEIGNIYFISTAVYPVLFDLEKQEEALQSALDSMVAALVNGQLISAEMVDFKDQSSLDFVIQDANKILHQGKLLIQDRTLYQAFVSYEEGALEEDDYRYFLTSLDISP